MFGSRPFSLSAEGLMSLDRRPVRFEHAAKLMLGRDWKGYLDEQVELRNVRLDVVEKVSEVRHSHEFQQALTVRSRDVDPQSLPSVHLVAGFKLDVRGLLSPSNHPGDPAKALRNLDPDHFKGISAEEIEKRALEAISPRK